MREALVHNLVTHLKSCWLRRELQWGRRIHAKAVQCLIDYNIFVATALVKMYSKCGSMADARRMFETIQEPDVVSWNVLLFGYAENGETHTALECLSRMKALGCMPSSVTYIAALQACASLVANGGSGECLERTREIHLQIGCSLDQHLKCTLVNIYAKCGSMADARRVFESIQNPDVVSWNALLMGYAENGKGLAALEMFSAMKARGYVPRSITYVAALKSCASLAMDGDRNFLERGRSLHAEIGNQLDLHVQNTLVDMYSKCGSMLEAQQVFDRIENPNVVSWTALLLGYAENGEELLALHLFSNMKERGCVPNSVTYIAALKACIFLAVNGDDAVKQDCLERGRAVHSEIGSYLNRYVQNTLVDLYAKCGNMPNARQVFDCIHKPDVVSWNILLLGYAENGDGLTALELFSRMKAFSCAPNSVTYVAAVKACTSLAASGGKELGLKHGREIHAEIGCRLELVVHNVLIDMYTNCGCMAEAHQVFDMIEKPSVVSWTALILGYAENGEGYVSLDLFSRMKADGCVPNSVTYIATLRSCGLVGALAFGRKLHREMSEFPAQLVTCLVDFYAKCGSMVEAHHVFDLHSKGRATPSWNSLLAGYGNFGSYDTVFSLFEAMQDEGFRPDAVTLVCVLSCCSHAGLIDKAREYLGAMPVQYKVPPNVIHYTCLVDLLGRANRLNEAVAVMRRMSCNPDAVTWKAVLSACDKWKNANVARMAFQAFVQMESKDSSAHVLMANIYGSRGMWEEQERVLGTMLGASASSRPLEQAYVEDEMGSMLRFVVGKRCSPEIEDYLGWLCEGMGESRNAAVHGDELCGHCERLAAVYGILKTPPGQQVRVYKKTRMCEDCHCLIKLLSKRSGRAVVIKDASRFHSMADGSCSCGEDW